MILFELGLALFFLAISAFLSAAETGLVSLSAQKTKHLALRNPHLRQHLLSWISRPHDLIVVILMGNTLAVVLFATLTTAVAFKLFRQYSPTHVELFGWAVQTLCVVTLGEIIPKIFARSYPEKTTVFVLPFLVRMEKIARPVVKIFTRLISVIAPMSVPTSPNKQLLTFNVDELKSLLEEDHGQHDKAKDSLTMMQKAIEINTKTVGHIMTPVANVDFVDLGPDEDFMIDLIIEKGHTRTPVRRNGRVIGFIHSFDLLPLIMGETRPPLDKLVSQPLYVSSDTQVSTLLNHFKGNETHIAFVNDAAGEMVGLITLEDVLEEITGEILDEYDVVSASGERP